MLYPGTTKKSWWFQTYSSTGFPICMDYIWVHLENLENEHDWSPKKTLIFFWFKAEISHD
jgi:hypothetical protein